MANEHANIISSELNLMRKHVNACLKLLDAGASVPFISRYRKEVTGGMNDITVRAVQLRHLALEELDHRKKFISDAISAAGAMTEALKERIAETWDPIVLEDIYAPYKPKRQTRAQTARDKGLEPLAKRIMAQNQPLPAVGEEDLAGASYIIAEWVSDSEKARAIVRSRFQRSAVITSTVVEGKEKEGRNYQNYFNFSEPLRLCNSHRYLAMRRGESEGILKVNISIDDDEMTERLTRMFLRSSASPEVAEVIRRAVRDGYRRLLRESMEREAASLAKEKSDNAAIQVFADNVRQLLMAPPLGHKRVLALDPGYKTGCKLVILDQQGNLLEHDVIFPNPPVCDMAGASDALCFYIDRYETDVIAIGSGTAGRDTERFVNSLMLPRPVKVYMVNEDGASVYSAGEVAQREFPDQDETVRGAVSIGRRLLDPLAELVKIDPKAIGVGQYQHDVNQTHLKDALDYVVQKCVNEVGVNVNTASPELLSYVSGIGPVLAANIVKHRADKGNFRSRQDLLEVPRMGQKAFEQCAGFLRIPDSANPLDNTGIHPERYELVAKIAEDNGADVERLARDRDFLHNIDLQPYVTKQVGLPTLTDIVLELEKPGRDPRAVDEQEVEYDSAISSINDLHVGMELMGKVNNITAFGVFVDLGLKENGLVHISQLCDHFISSPAEVVSIGQPVRMRVIDVDNQRGRIALTMKLGNTEQGA